MGNSMGTIRVSSEELQRTAGEFLHSLNEAEQAFDSINQTVGSTATYWVGIGADAHRELLREQIENVNTILARYREHVRDLREMAGVYSEAEETAVAEAEELPLSDL